MIDRDELVMRLRNPLGTGFAPTLWFSRASDQIERDGREIERLTAENQRLREALSTIVYHTAFLDREWLSADLNSRLDAARAASGPAAFKSRRTISGAGMTLEERQEMVDNMNRRQRAMGGREPDVLDDVAAHYRAMRAMAEQRTRARADLAGEGET